MKIQLQSQAIEFSYKKYHSNWHQAIFEGGMGIEPGTTSCKGCILEGQILSGEVLDGAND